LFAVSALVDSEPVSPLVPLQPPVAVHELASVDVHDSVEVPPLPIDAGLAVKLTVGAGGGGGAAITVTCAEALALPPAPVQVSE
jgi:hypothetical protein